MAMVPEPLAAGAKLAPVLAKLGARALLGTKGEQALSQAYEYALGALLEEVGKGREKSEAKELESVLKRFFDDEEVSGGILAFALRSEPPDLTRLAKRFDALGGDRETLPVDFDWSIRVFYRELTAHLISQAVSPESVLTAPAMLSTLLISEQLQQEQTATQVAIADTLAVIADRLQRLETVAETWLEQFVLKPGLYDEAETDTLLARLPTDLQQIVPRLQQYAQKRLPPPLTLRLAQAPGAEPDELKVEVSLEADGLADRHVEADVAFTLTEQDREDLRWYLEDFLKYPLDPAPEIAARVEQRMAEIGAELYQALFQANDEARDLWAYLRPRLKDTRVEVSTSAQDAGAIPWELLRDQRAATPLALSVRAFVRTQTPASASPPPVQTSGPIRILLAICRPGEGDDVPFRSVAGRLVRALDTRDDFQRDVLRPPTFEQLGRVLRAAEGTGQPYHIVHFDGHGMYADATDREVVEQRLREQPPDRLGQPQQMVGEREGEHGYLVFEDPDRPKNRELVSGEVLGELLVTTGVPVLVLNACRSAYTDAPARPATGEGDDTQDQVRAFGSLAQEVIGAGVAGVVAMRYNVYVVTAAQFVADLYGALTQGQSLGEAVTLGRKQLHDQPERTIAYDPRPLQDWSVPVVYEAAPIHLFPPQPEAAPLRIEPPTDAATPQRGGLDPDLPATPDVGFFGRDETLLALDRAFDTQPVVLLHAYAGSGKTTAAAEFARWYALTGGVAGPVLFSSFERHTPLAAVLAHFGQVFGPSLEQSGINWSAITELAQQREVALQVLRQVPVLWIWDNVEPITGFPAGSESAWSDEEQAELVAFLRAARDTQAKFLLTSRRDEQEWLHDLPRRITVPAMPMQERVQLTRALAEKYGGRLTDVEDWRPLLRFTDGNPLTITVLVGQALRDGLRSKDQIKAFVAQLRAGEAEFDDEPSEGRARSLGASLDYGFAHAFDEAERKQLALLHLFQGVVNVVALRVMGVPEPTGA
ncbi:MAG: hypothetical protein CL878_02895 [Dehalococcoidia bacterium]|nr:hypothetical protein [Dehalococcoidia bacterium]